MSGCEDPAIVHGVRDTGGRVTLAIFDCTKPVIGAINGAAVGIGATMTLAMDIRLASDKARIGFVFGKIGIVPEACSSWFLPRIVGMSAGARMGVHRGHLRRRGGEARRAREGGLSGRTSCSKKRRQLARRIVDNRSPVATALARQMMYRNAAQPHPIEAHRIDSLGDVLHERRRTARKACVRFWRSVRRTSRRASRPTCRRSTRSGLDA